MGHQFIALVGAPGAGKSTLLESLRLELPKDNCLFLRDSGSDQFCTEVSQLGRSGAHESATPQSQLLLFWARLAHMIQVQIAPGLRTGKLVVTDGFGGTVLAHALCHVRTEEEGMALVDLHKELIQHCVVGQGVPPPKYLWLKPSPEVAHDRLSRQGRLPRVKDPLSMIQKMNAGFDFYKTLPGQTVIPIDADQTAEMVLAEALRQIGHNMFARMAA